MDTSVEETELDVGSASDELESSSMVEPKVARRPMPRPFTIESLIGSACEAHDAGGGITRYNRTNGSEEEFYRDREYQLYQRHYLATAAASTLPSGESSFIYLLLDMIENLLVFKKHTFKLPELSSND